MWRKTINWKIFPDLKPTALKKKWKSSIDKSGSFTNRGFREKIYE